MAWRSPEDVLQQVFGYAEFRPTQKAVIDSVLAGRDTLAIMPTGGGKSLCYQIPALLFEGLTVVVSPLISLMQDQVRQLRAAGVNAVVLNSTIDAQDYALSRRAVASGHAKLLYVAPETLLQPRTLELLGEVSVSCLTIDEAHCISAWGHDFRPEYRQIADARRRFGDAVCIALTATATARVRDDIATSLGMRDDARFVASFDRPNLFLRAEEKDQALHQLLAFLDETPGRSGIVYCARRKTTETVAQQLRSRGLRVAPYHAGLSSEQRHATQELFIRDDLDVVVATVAFGMGIDKPDVRFVVHYDMPASVESYYQEVGRAGRDGEPARCLLLHGAADLSTIEFHIAQKSEAEQHVARLQLRHMRAFAETAGCRRRPLLGYFGEEAPEGGCGHCDNCVNPPPDVTDLTVPAQKFLSCVYRTGQRFGVNHIVDVLRGSTSERIARLGHDRLSTHGIGKEYDPAQWRALSRQLLQGGLLEQDVTHGGLSLGAEAGAVLRGERAFEGRIPPPRAAKKTRTRKPKPDERAIEYDADLFEELRTKRKALADEKKVPPYVVFSDRTLREIAAKLPRDEAAFGAIHGVGAQKLETYGPTFIAVVQTWCRDHAD